MTSTNHDHADECAATCVVGRRAFLRDAVTAAAVLAGVSALGPLRELSAMEPRSATGTIKYPIPATDSVSIDSTNEVILCRAAGEVYAFALSCPHQNTALRAIPGGGGFQCSRHKSKYMANGTYIEKSGKATRNMDRLSISRAGDAVVVDPAVAFLSDEEPDKWAGAKVKL
jgi:nitrite reductase/ring-hydroxylating ferredoxin subunit